MFADTHQTRTLEVSRSERPIMFGLTAGWLIIGLAVAGLLLGLTWSYNSVRYPGAERQSAAQFQLRAGALSQQSVYQTADDLPQVLGWYAQQLGLGHDTPQGDHCVTMTRVDALLIFQRSFTVTLCADQTQTLIFINRSLAVH